MHVHSAYSFRRFVTGPGRKHYRGPTYAKKMRLKNGDTMGRGQMGTQWDGGTMGQGHNGMGTRGHNGMGTQWDGDTMGRGHNGGTQWDGDTMGRGHNKDRPLTTYQTPLQGRCA